MIPLDYSKLDRSKVFRDAWNTAVLVLAASILDLIVIIYGMVVSPARQHYFVLAAGVLYVIGNIASLLLIRKGYIAQGMVVLVGGTWLLCSTVSWMYAGLALPMSIVAMLVSVWIVLQTLPGRTGLFTVVASLALGLINSTIGWMTPAWQLTIINEQLAYLIVPLPIVLFVVMIMRRFRTYTLRAKLVVLFLAVSLTGIISTAIIAALLSNSALSENAGAQLKNITEAKALTIGELLNRQYAALNTLAISHLIQLDVQSSNDRYTGDVAQDLAEILAIDEQWQESDLEDTLVQQRLNNAVALDLQEYLTMFPGIEQVLVTDRLGALVAATEFSSVYYQGNTTWWRSAYNTGLGGDYFGQPEIDQDDGNYYITIAVPIRERETGGVIGVLQANFELNELSSLLAVDLGETGELDLYFSGRPTQVFHEGTLSMAAPDTLALFRSIEAQPFAELTLDGTLSIVSQTRVQTASGTQSIDDLGWTIIAHQARDEALAVVQRQTRVITMWSLVITVLVAGFAYITGIVLTGPITRLTEDAQKVASGNLNIQAKIESADEVGVLAQTFNGMIIQLREMVDTLEQRVAERTRALETSATISRRISTILDQRMLIHAVVDQIQQAFGYYHVHIYLYDDTRQYLVMSGGSGEIGQELLDRGHRIPHSKGLVGRTADTNTPSLVSDVSQNDWWLPNPLLPATKAEAAVPIALGEVILGVLDVQNDAVGSLGQQDVDLLLTIANQLAVAIQNTRTYARAQQQATREALISTISQKIQSTTSIAEAVQVAIREAGRATGAPRVQVKLSMQKQPEVDEEPR